jgi:Rps23 Pro-64 3,4-dihydroxylase Tpa1-like proline 4-hydroxylase
MSDWVERLMRVQVVVEQQFWLTLPELADLLQIPLPPTQSSGFMWRNFVCTPVPNSPEFWQISRAQAVPTVQLPQIQKQISSQPAPGSLASQYVQIENFLPPDLVSKLLDLTLAKESAFVPTGVTTQDKNYRQSLFLPSFSQLPVWPLILAKIEQVMPAVMEILGIPNFAVADIEAQLTAHNDGNYYKVHNDNGSPPTATRVFTYVYYFHRDPKAFEGGELKIFDTKIQNNYYVAAESFSLVEPIHNSIVFFLSRYLHEVLPVRCPSRQFADSRFTVNGWIRSHQILHV